MIADSVLDGDLGATRVYCVPISIGYEKVLEVPFVEIDARIELAFGGLDAETDRVGDDRQAAQQAKRPALRAI